MVKPVSLLFGKITAGMGRTKPSQISVADEGGCYFMINVSAANLVLEVGP